MFNNSLINMVAFPKTKMPYQLIWVFTILLSLLGSNFSIAQTIQLDQLTSDLDKATSELERINLMSQLSKKYKTIEFDKSLNYAHKALALSKKIGDKKEEVKALLIVGTLAYETTNKDSSFVYLKQGEQMAEVMGLGKLQADLLMKIAKSYRFLNHDSTNTVKHLLKSVVVSKAASYDYGTGRTYAKLASFYTKYREIDLIERYLELSAKYYLRVNGGRKDIAHYYNEVGGKIWDVNPKKSMDFYLKGMEYDNEYPNIKVSLARAHFVIGEPKKALEYLKPAIRKLREKEHLRVLGIALGLEAEVYVELGDYQAANKNCDESIAILSPLARSRQISLPAIYRTKGRSMELQGNREEALKYYKKSHDEASKIKARYEINKTNLSLANFYRMEDQSLRKHYCELALKNSRNYNLVNFEVLACDCLYNIYKSNNEDTKALKYYEQKIMLSDSMNTLKVGHALNINSKLAQKDNLLAEQAYQKEIREAKLQNQYKLNSVLFVSSIFGLLLIGFLSIGIKRIRKQNLEIKKKNKEITIKTDELKNVNQSLGHSNEELERFAYIASHDLKSPLNNIISFTKVLRQALEKDENENPSIKQSLNFIERSGNRMNQLIEDILEYSKISNQDTTKIENQPINLNHLVQEISQLIVTNRDGDSKNIHATNLPEIKWNSSKIFLLFKNLIENGLKYNESEKPCVKVYCNFINGVHTIYFEDNGIGIKKEYFDKIFVMFQRLHNYSKYEGTGLGLATCKKIVNEFEGSINIKSEVGKGTTFIVEIPNSLIHKGIDKESWSPLKQDEYTLHNN